MTEKEIRYRRNLIEYYRKVSLTAHPKVKDNFVDLANRLERELEKKIGNGR